MRFFQSIRSTIYNKVWGKPKSLAGAFLRRKCDGIPENRRLMVVTVMLALFILTAFFVFGNACYRIGRGHAAVEGMETGHIKGLTLPVSDGDSPDIIPLETNAYEFAGTENENQ